MRIFYKIKKHRESLYLQEVPVFYQVMSREQRNRETFHASLIRQFNSSLLMPLWNGKTKVMCGLTRSDKGSYLFL